MQIETDRSAWYVVKTAPRAEYKAAKALSRAGFGTYLPERKIETQHRRSKAWSERVELVMPRYLFVLFPDPCAGEWQADRPSWFALRRCEGVSEPLGWTSDDGETIPLPLPGRVVERLMAAQGNMEFDDTREAKRRRGQFVTLRDRFPVGKRVTIMDGPFRSFAATVDGVTGQGLLSVLVEVFGRMTPVTVDVAQLTGVAELAEAA